MPNQHTRVHRPAIIPIGPSIAYLPLTQDQYALIDSWRVAELGVDNFCAHLDPANNQFYAVRSRRKMVPDWLHRRLMGNPDVQVDHIIPTRTLDCREANLRLATSIQNGANKHLTKLNKSGFKGVSWDKRKKKYRATLREKHLGYYDDPAAAHEVWKIAAKEKYGEFVRFS